MICCIFIATRSSPSNYYIVYWAFNNCMPIWLKQKLALASISFHLYITIDFMSITSTISISTRCAETSYSTSWTLSILTPIMLVHPITLLRYALKPFASSVCWGSVTVSISTSSALFCQYSIRFAINISSPTWIPWAYWMAYNSIFECFVIWCIIKMQDNLLVAIRCCSNMR